MISRLSALALASVFLSAQAADWVVETPGQRALFDSYQMCATLRLPEDFRTIRDAEATAALATDKCRGERLALAGQFALDNPGTRQVDKFLEIQRRRIVLALSNWIEASTVALAPHPLTPLQR